MMETKTLNLDKLNSEDPKVKYGFAKELLKIGAETPEMLYGSYDYWIKMTTGNNNILKWTAIDILGYISAVDKDNKTVKEIKNLFKLLHSGKLITCNHAVFALGLIAKNKPGHRKQIIKELIAISKDTFETEECKKIAAGKVIETLKYFPDEIITNHEALDFIRQAQNSSRNATRKKADALMKKINAHNKKETN